MSNEKELYGVTALFDTPDDILNAAKKVKQAGYSNFDVNTPYPIHGMDPAMGLKSSKMGYVTLFGGFSAAAFILLFMWWTLSIDYPLVIGGKPFFALPAFVPITFETTVLIGVLSTVFGMIAVMFNLPLNNHPLHDTDYMKNVSSDKYGVVIEAEDPLFDKDKVVEFLKGLGAKTTEFVYFPEQKKIKALEPKFIIFLILVAVATCGGTYVTLNKFMYLPPYDFMLNQDKGVSQEESPFFSNKREMRQPVQGTVARGYIPYAYQGNLNPTETLSNPLLPTKEVLELGHRKFLTYCSPCHGNFANGNSRLMGQFPPGVSLHSDLIRGYTDGRIYNVITNGSTVMPSYARQITRQERWAIVTYIRALQRAEDPKPSDFKEIKEINKESVENAQN
jgi:mono/diheme cytochrome c family protein